MKKPALITSALILIGICSTAAGGDVRMIIPAATKRAEVPDAVMSEIFDKVKTPYKYGIIPRDQDGVVYHFYCAVGNEGGVIAPATSKDLRPKEIE